MRISGESAGRIVDTGYLVAGTTASQITEGATPLCYGVKIKADIANDGRVHVGEASTVTGSKSATDGYVLFGGDEVDVEIDDLSKLRIIASKASQGFWYLAR